MSGSIRKHAKRLGGLALVCCLMLAVFAWLRRDQVAAWYYVRGLSQAGEQDRDAWAQRVERLAVAAVPALVHSLAQDNARACGNAEMSLTRLVEQWGPDDPRSISVAERLAEGFPRLSTTGKGSALRVIRALGQLVKGTSVPETLVRSAASAIRLSVVPGAEAARPAALELALSPIGIAKTGEMVEACRDLARACLRDEAAGTRVLALRLAAQPEMQLREEIVGLLQDPAPEVRRAAMLELGPTPALISTDELLPWLHDADADVRKLCEAALRGRGLRDEHLKMGRLVTDRRATQRLKVLDYLHDHSELDQGLWLRRLSHDPTPAVRAATVRASASEGSVDLSDRLEQMAQNDPSPTVRQLARFYLSCRKPE